MLCSLQALDHCYIALLNIHCHELKKGFFTAAPARLQDCNLADEAILFESLKNSIFYFGYV